MALLDDLKGILGDDAIAKIEGNPALKARVAKSDELYSYYVGEEPSAASTTTTTPPASTPGTPNPSNPPASTPGAFDLSSIDSLFDRKLGDLDKRIDTRLEQSINTRGSELVNSAVKIAIQRNDELNRLYSRYEKATGKEFDSADFNAFLEKPENKNKFRSIAEAGDAYLAPTLEEKRVEEKVAERLKATSGQHAVPGSTPGPGSNKTIEFFRGRNTAGTPSTGASRAAEALERRMASREAAAS